MYQGPGSQRCAGHAFPPLRDAVQTPGGTKDYVDHRSGVGDRSRVSGTGGSHFATELSGH